MHAHGGHGGHGGHSHGGDDGGHSHSGAPPTVQPFPGEDLFIAATWGHQQVILQTLESGGNPNELDQYGLTALHRAVEHKQIGAIQGLVYHGANVNSAGSWAVQETPLHWAARKGDKGLDTLRVLLALGADVRARDAHGYTALHHAAQAQQSSFACQLLLTCGAEIGALDCERRSALHLAAAAGNVSNSFFLADRGADMHAFDQGGQTPAAAAESKHHETLAQGLSGDPSSIGHTLGPWQMHGFLRPNQMLSPKDIVVPMLATPLMFYLFGVLPWYLSIAAAGVMMTLVSSALIPKKGAKVKANPALHTFYISCVVFTYLVLLHTVGLAGMHWLHMLVFLATTVVMVICFSACSYSDPGVIPHNEQDYRDCMLAGERGVSLEGLCSTCMIRKPLRSKHCSVMNVCVAEFDHFCPWCNNAVGHSNYLPFVGWCVFEFVNHIQIVYLMGSWLLAEIGATSVFPITQNLVAMNQLHPTVLYLAVFNVLCCLMALQLSMFQAGNIKVNLTTNERMNAFRYPYLMEYQQTGLVGNPYDKGGTMPNLKALLRRGLWDVRLPRFEYKSLDVDIEKVAGASVAEELDIHDAGESFTFARELNLVAAHKFVVALTKSCPDETTLADCRMLLPHVLRRASVFPAKNQAELLEALTLKLPLVPGMRLDQQLIECAKECIAANEAKTKEIEEKEKEVLASQPESTIQANYKAAARATEELDPKKAALLAMTEYNLQHRRLIAQQVLEPEQLLEFLKDHAEMEHCGSLTSKQEVLKRSQEKMKALLSTEQQAAMKQYMLARMGEWKKAQPDGLQPPEPLVRELPEEVVEYMLKQQYVCAQQVLNQDQFTIFKDGYSNAQTKTSTHEKQLAFMQTQKQLGPLLSSDQKQETKQLLQLKLIEYNKQHQTHYWA